MARDLTSREAAILHRMIENLPESQKLTLGRQLHAAKVVPMTDGGMGSLGFAAPCNCDRRLGSTVAEAEFSDEDGVLVSLALNLDSDGKLFELDVWKVDFSPLRMWPKPEKLTIK